MTKKEIMKESWRIFKKGSFETFAEALKAVWAINKKATKDFADEIQKDITERMYKNSELMKKAKANNLVSGEWGKRIYTGEGKTTWANKRIWSANRRIRMYADEIMDGMNLGQKYIEIKF